MDSGLRVILGRGVSSFGSSGTRGASGLMMREASVLMLRGISDLAVTEFSSEREETGVVSDLAALGLK